MRKPFAVGRLTQRSAEIVILREARSQPRASASRALRDLVRLSRLDRELGRQAAH